MNAHLKGAFWSWSLERYEREGAAALLLRLQDDFNLNVNILMWCCWYAEHHGVAPAGIMNEAVRSEEKFNTKVTARLRAARRWLKKAGNGAEKDCEELRALIKEAELRAEKIEQARLEALAPAQKEPSQPPRPLDAAKANLAAYGRLVAAPAEAFASLPKTLMGNSLQDAPTAPPIEQD